MVRPDKVAEVELLTDKLGKAQCLVLANFSGLTVADMGELRGKCREQNVEFRVVKNRLLKRASVGMDNAVIEQLLTGPTGVAFGLAGPVDPAKVLVEFAKGHEKLEIKGGFLDGALLTATQVEALATIPGRQELLCMIARGFQGPTQNFVGVLHGLMSKCVRTLDAVAKQKAEAA